MVYCMIYSINNQHLSGAPETAVIVHALVALSFLPSTPIVRGLKYAIVMIKGKANASAYKKCIRRF